MCPPRARQRPRRASSTNFPDLRVVVTVWVGLADPHRSRPERRTRAHGRQEATYSNDVRSPLSPEPGAPQVGAQRDRWRVSGGGECKCSPRGSGPGIDPEKGPGARLPRHSCQVRGAGQDIKRHDRRHDRSGAKCAKTTPDELIKDVLERFQCDGLKIHPKTP